MARLPKMKSFIKKVQNLHELHTMLALMSVIPDHMKFLVDDSMDERYKDNPELLKEHAILCFKDFSRLRGKKEDSSIALSQFLELYAAEFPDEGVQIDNDDEKKITKTGKTKRKSSGGGDEESSIFEHLPILKSIIKQLMKHELAEPFLYPVDSNAIPEYYEIIKNPMDLNTALDTLADCKSVDEALNNLRTIWENCRIFNQEGSAIMEAANTLSNLLEELIVTKLSSVKAQSNVKFDKRRKIVLDKRAMKRVIKELKAMPYTTPFIEPVNLEDAPGYLDYVTTMMDLTTIEANIQASVYTSSKQFRNDLQLIVTNCEAYNHEDSDIVSMAHQFNEKFDELVSAAENNVIVEVQVQEVNDTSLKKDKTSGIKRSKGGVPLSQNVMLKIVQDLKNQPSAVFFLHPVNFDEAPGYKELILHPMDLSLIEKNIKLNEYSDSEAFKYDLNLISQNCQEYNHEESAIYTMSIEFQTIADELIKAAEDAARSREETETKKRSKVDETRTLAKSEDDIPDSVDNSKLDTYNYEQLSTWKTNKLEPLQIMLTKNNAKTLEAVRFRCALRAREIQHHARSGFWDKNGVYNVLKMGKIATSEQTNEVIQNYHTSACLYPHNYKCNVYLRACVVPEKDEPLELDISDNSTPYVDILFSNTICGATATKKDSPQFALSFDNGVFVSESINPGTLWTEFMHISTNSDNILEFFKTLGGKIHRCRAVFNRICCHPDITPFLEQIPHSGSLGNEYYETIKSPMWLREVHTRLVNGLYDFEFDFAWDMRLIFQNCMEFNKPGSDLYVNAQKILYDFEQLFCFWVHSIQDINFKDHAIGEFDDWQHLRYFDVPDANHHFCRKTNATLPESELIMCIICEDEYSLSVAGIERKTNDVKRNYKCERCLAMEEILPFGFTDIPAMSEKTKPYSTEDLFDFQWVPSQDEKISAEKGWAQAKAVKQQRVTNRFMSPFGVKYSKRDEALKCLYEIKRDHEKLLVERAKEYQESISGKKIVNSSPRRARRSRREENGDDTEATKVADNSLTTEVINEDGRIVYGKLYDFKIPQGYRLSWYIKRLAWPDPKVQANPAIANQLVKIQHYMIGSTGFFGLHVEDIRRAIESLDKSELCYKYEFLDADMVVQELSNDIAMIINSKAQIQDATSKINSILASQKWYWEVTEKNLRKTWGSWRVEASATAINMNAPEVYGQMGFKPLFPTINHKHGELLLATWDFLDSVRSILGDNPFTFNDLVESVEKPHFICSYGQILFDDLCCHLTGLLLQELKATVFSKKEAKWHRFCLYKPLNLLSWPSITQAAIFFLTKPVEVAENIVDWANICNDEESLIRKEIIILVMAHPSVPYLKNINELIEIRARVASMSYNDNEDFITAIIKIFDDALNIYYPESKDFIILSDMYKWFRKLVERMGIAESKLSEEEAVGAVPTIEVDKTSKPSDNFINPFDFGNLNVTDNGDRGNFEVRMEALNALETTLTLLRSSEPETWSTDEKLAIMATLVDYGSRTELFSEIRCFESPTNSYVDISDVPEVPENPHDYEYCTSFSKGDFCYFTGQLVEPVPSMKWVFVPDILLEKSNINESLHPNGPPIVTGRPICPEIVVNRIFAAREITENKRKKYDDFLSKILDDLENDNFQLSLGKSTLGRGIPIGLDRMGSQYWILDAQAHMTFGTSDINQPCVLLRHCSGWWGVYTARNLAPLLDSLDRRLDIERVLRETIIIRLYRARFDFLMSRIPIEGSFGNMYEQWLQRHKKLLDKAKSLTIPDDVNSMDSQRGVSMVEHFWHSYVEVRATLYHAILQRKMDEDCRPIGFESAKSVEKRRKKIRDSWPDDTFECHPLKGFFRCDAFQSIRNIMCTLTGTRIMADPYALILYIGISQKSRTRVLMDQTNEKMQQRLRDLIFEKEEAERLKQEEQAEDVDMYGDGDVDVDVDVDVDGEGEQNKEDDNGQNTIVAGFDPNMMDVDYLSHITQPAYQSPLIKLPNPPTGPGQGTIIQKMKAVEQLHLTSGEVLRIYKRGKDAADMMGISHSGISLCCSGKQSEFCGFKWRFYTGPPATFEQIEGMQTPIEDLLNMKVYKNKPASALPAPSESNVFSLNLNDLKDTESREISEPATHGILQQYSYRPTYPTYPLDKERESKEEVVLSTVLVSGRLLKIKSELINLLYVLPERKLQFPEEPDEHDEADEHQNDDDLKELTEEERREREKVLKAERKKKRRERRAQGLNRLTTRIQEAATVRELYQVMIYLEDSYFAAIENFDFDASMFPSETNLSSMLAVRLFTFDRCLRYDTIDLIDKISKPDTAHLSKKYKNKLQYVPKCYISPNCNLSMAHYHMHGCNTSCTGSRICENAKESRAPVHQSWAPPSHSNITSIYPKSKSKSRSYNNDDDEEEEEEDEEEEDDEYWDTPNGRKKKKLLGEDIETVTPVIPPKYLWKSTKWL